MKKQAKKTAKKKAPSARSKAKSVPSVTDYDYSTAEAIPEGDSRYSQIPGLISFLVNDQEGNQVTMITSTGNVPKEARKALGMD